MIHVVRYRRRIKLNTPAMCMLHLSDLPNVSSTAAFTYCYFPQVDAVVEGVPGTLLVVGSPGLLKHFTNTLSFLASHAIAAGDARCPGDAVGSGVSLSARVTRWPLQTASVLRGVKYRRERTGWWS